MPGLRPKRTGLVSGSALRPGGWALRPAVTRAFIFSVFFALASGASAQDLPPELTRPVNDFAGVIDAGSEAALESLIRSLQAASGDVVVVATVETTASYGDIRPYAVKMFENRGRGIGQKGRDNGLLILLAVKDRKVWVEVGYDLEEFVTDGFSGEVSRTAMAPEFRRGDYGAGLLAGAQAIVGRIAERRNVVLPEAERPPAPRNARDDDDFGGAVMFALFVLFILLKAIAARTQRGGRRRRWGGGPWGGWSSGVGPFGGGFGGGFGRGGGFGGGFGGFGGGGGFGGFGGGRSGGGGGGASW